MIYLRPEAQTKVISMFHFALRDSGVLLLGSSEHEPKRSRATVQRDPPQVADLEQELKVTRTELQVAIRSLEIAGEEQKAVNEEALSINEEYQSTNEELLTSKEELQSLNEELAALNSQLRELLERQRTTSNDLQNVLYSTGVARSSSIPASISASSRPPPSRCSASFPVTSGDGLATLLRWPPMAAC